jgi:hypothetical protein
MNRKNIALIAACLLMAGVVLLWVPEWMANQIHFTTAKDWAEYVSSTRSTLVNVIGGLAVAVTIYFTFQNYLVSRETLATESFSKAVEKLGSDKVSVRLGGIYALARIAQQSSTVYFSIMQILAAHIQAQFDVDKAETTPRPTHCPIEVQSILTIIGERYWPDLEGYRIDLSYSRITQAWMPRADFHEIYFWGSKLDNVNFQGAKLDGADFKDAVLDHCNFDGASLAGTNFQGAEILTSIYLTEEQLLKAAHQPKKWTQLAG